jgi:hypothetical protein
MSPQDSIYSTQFVRGSVTFIYFSLHFITIFEQYSLLHLGQIPTTRSTQLPLSIVGRPTNLGPPQTSFHMTSFFRQPHFRLYCDVSNVARDIANVARPMFQTWQERRLKRGKRDIRNVARPTSRTWQEQHLKRGKRDI